MLQSPVLLNTVAYEGLGFAVTRNTYSVHKQNKEQYPKEQTRGKSTWSTDPESNEQANNLVSSHLIDSSEGLVTKQKQRTETKKD